MVGRNQPIPLPRTLRGFFCPAFGAVGATLDSGKGFREYKNMKKDSSGAATENPSVLIDARIKELNDWRGQKLAEIRAIIHEADPEVVEEWKWRGVPVWSHNGIICTGETYKAVVKMTFAKGAALEDPSGLFNASLEGNTRRAIDIHEDDKIDAKALKTLVRSAITLNSKK
ncbi:UNVERIFIED_ORG: hypothetical protein J2X80_004732 [Pseudomonas fluorescens]|nr:hypothetical protein [Pseudomonas fluorescens]